MTEVEYESGEVEFELIDGSDRTAVTLGYGSGVGVTEEVHCDTCGQRLTEESPLQNIAGGLQCRECGSTGGR